MITSTQDTKAQKSQTMSIHPRVIFFEDDRLFREFFSNFLVRKFIHVNSYADPADASTEISSGEYEGAVFDINDSSTQAAGLMLAQQFIERFPEAPCYCVSGYQEFEYRVKEIGAIYIKKPVSTEAGKSIAKSLWSRFLDTHNQEDANQINLKRNEMVFNEERYVETENMGILESIHDRTLFVSFNDPKYGWGIVGLKAPASVEINNLQIGSALALSIMHGDGRIAGFRIIELGISDASIGFSTIEKSYPLRPINLDDPVQLALYEKQLRKTLGE
jgi:ActR/RegA family two-component response regulator